MEWYWIFLFFFLLIVFLINFEKFFPKKNLEGFEDSSNSSTVASGIAGNAQTYAANIKTAFTQNQDMLLISKYRTDYENCILNLDDYINSVMLKTALSIDTAKPSQAIQTLVQLNEAKSALNNIIKFIDSSH